MERRIPGGEGASFSDGEKGGISSEEKTFRASELLKFAKLPAKTPSYDL